MLCKQKALYFSFQIITTPAFTEKGKSAIFVLKQYSKVVPELGSKSSRLKTTMSIAPQSATVCSICRQIILSYTFTIHKWEHKIFFVVQLWLYNADLFFNSVSATRCLSLTPSTMLANTQHDHSSLYADALCKTDACSKFPRTWTARRIILFICLFSIRIRMVAKKVIVVSLRNTNPGKTNGAWMCISSYMLMFTYFVEVNILHPDILHHWSFFIYIGCDYSEGNTALPKHPYHWKRKPDTFT